MKKIEKIIIKGSSGYGPGDAAYEDRITITPDTISYVFYSAYDEGKRIKWRFKSDSEVFRIWYEAVCRGVEEQLDSKAEPFCTDVGGVDFKVVYEDRTKKQRWFCTTTEYFSDLFRLIKKMVPLGEEVPNVLRTTEDYRSDYKIEAGKYRHFKGKEYEVLEMARHSETEQEMVVYKALYGDGDIWVRPAAMWEETVHRNGQAYQRFSKIDNDEK